MIIIAVDENRDDLDLISDLIYDSDPDSEIIEHDDPLVALGYARQNRVDVAFISVNMADLNGIELAKYLKELNPSVNIIFLSDDDKNVKDAMDMHASGYVVKPATQQRVKWELSELRYPEYQKEHKRVFAQTFGNFEFFVDGTPVEFKYKRTKEIVALLVNNKGAQTTNGEIMASLWEDEGDPDKKVSYLCNLRQDLQNTFTRLKLDGVLVKQRGSLGIAKDRIECDLYDWLENRSHSKYTYTGEYMNQYSWPEFYRAELDDLSFED
ncbi:MAG: response regulator [Lachnospiraceae bacterium]|nr:response regulator [Lachnospiraceae bacterium]